MWMEPDELPAPKFSVVKSESRVVRQYTPLPEQNGGFVPMLNRPNYATISRVENYEPQVVSRSEYQNPVPAEQNFFPSFFRGAPVSQNQNQRPYKTKSNSAAASIAGKLKDCHFKSRKTVVNLNYSQDDIVPRVVQTTSISRYWDREILQWCVAEPSIRTAKDRTD
jgi:hypothetical protein